LLHRNQQQFFRVVYNVLRRRVGSARKRFVLQRGNDGRKSSFYTPTNTIRAQIMCGRFTKFALLVMYYVDLCCNFCSTDNL